MKSSKKGTVDHGRRQLIGAAGGGLVAAMAGGAAASFVGPARAENVQTLRWGIVGTGMIARSMARVMGAAPSATLAAVSSRRLESAQAFAKTHGAGRAFDSWEDMCAWEGVDAIYVATPTSVRETICVAAANSRKHVLGEKPFASLPSLQRITLACRTNGVGFMDGTHFVHHPRTPHIRETVMEKLGWPWSLDSAFQFNLPDRGNIRFNQDLEPLGGIGDTGWYNMRAAVEYLAPDARIASLESYLRRDDKTGAAISGSGVIRFDDGSTTTWNCGMDSGAVIGNMRLTGTEGVVSLENFVSHDQDGSATYELRGGRGSPETITVPSSLPAAALMFEDFAAMVLDEEWRERSIQASERTQAWLDAIWNSALENEA